MFAALACAVACAPSACGGQDAPSEHTATVVRGSYGDPDPIVACGNPDAAGDAAPDGC